MGAGSHKAAALVVAVLGDTAPQRRGPCHAAHRACSCCLRASKGTPAEPNFVDCPALAQPFLTSARLPLLRAQPAFARRLSSPPEPPRLMPARPSRGSRAPRRRDVAGGEPYVRVLQGPYAGPQEAGAAAALAAAVPADALNAGAALVERSLGAALFPLTCAPAAPFAVGGTQNRLCSASCALARLHETRDRCTRAQRCTYQHRPSLRGLSVDARWTARAPAGQSQRNAAPDAASPRCGRLAVREFTGAAARPLAVYDVSAGRITLDARCGTGPWHWFGYHLHAMHALKCLQPPAHAEHCLSGLAPGRSASLASGLA